MRHHGFSCSSLYTVTPEQAQENLLIEMLRLTRLRVFNHIMAIEAFNHIMAVFAKL